MIALKIFNIYSHRCGNDNSSTRIEKTRKYTHLHNNLKHQSKLFRKRYEIEQSLERKEKEAKDCCNIFKNNYDDKCMDVCEDIEILEERLKKIQIKMKLHRICLE
jgi:hypothetical protein